MPDLTELIGTWGYAAIFLVIILGNVGLPVPEESVLTISGYLTSQGQLHFSLVVALAIVAAVIGDNMGYWLGRWYGQRILGRLIAAAPERVERARKFVVRHGALAVFSARFIMGLRFMAGPLAGSTGLEPIRFFVANLLGAIIYVPIVVGVGYAIGYGLGEYIERFRRAIGLGEDVALVALALAAIVAWIILSRRHRHS
jgi:membrane protein DedA with SNARE-associated domain